jgi:hypothetical protein
MSAGGTAITAKSKTTINTRIEYKALCHVQHDTSV